jgi:hypothetical protein
MHGSSQMKCLELLTNTSYLRKAQNPTLDMVLGIMRLSHKYQIEGLQQRMRRKLQKHCPLTYADSLAPLARFVVVGSPRYRLAQEWRRSRMHSAVRPTKSSRRRSMRLHVHGERGGMILSESCPLKMWPDCLLVVHDPSGD